MVTTARSERVLLVDTSLDEREMYAAWLRHKGYCTLQAATAHDACRLATELAPTVVVTADRLGTIDGFELTRRLKHDAHTRHIRVVMMTSRETTSIRDAAVIAGCDALMSKPCLPAQLERALELLRTTAAPLDQRGNAAQNMA